VGPSRSKNLVASSDNKSHGNDIAQPDLPVTIEVRVGPFLLSGNRIGIDCGVEICGQGEAGAAFLGKTLKILLCRRLLAPFFMWRVQRVNIFMQNSLCKEMPSC